VIALLSRFSACTSTRCKRRSNCQWTHQKHAQHATEQLTETHTAHGNDKLCHVCMAAPGTCTIVVDHATGVQERLQVAMQTWVCSTHLLHTGWGIGCVMGLTACLLHPAGGPWGGWCPLRSSPWRARTSGTAINTFVNLLMTFAVGQCFLSMLCAMRFGVRMRLWVTV